VVYEPAIHRGLLDAVSDLITVFGRDQVRLGTYSAAQISPIASWWQPREDAVKPFRPTALLDMLTRILPRGETPRLRPDPGEEMPLSDQDRDAVHLLASIALASKKRKTDGIVFWGGMFRHRVKRYCRLDLSTMTSRLMDDLGAGLCEGVREPIDWPGDRQERCMQAIRDRTVLLVSLAYDHMREMRDGEDT